MKRTQIIKITPCKKKNLTNDKGNKYFNKLSKNMLGHLFSFFKEEEQLKILTLNSKFKAAFLSINEINENEVKDWCKYISSLIKLENESKGFSTYLNIFLNINIINTSIKYFGINSNNINKANILKKIIERQYQETKLNKLLIQINSKEDFDLYYSILNLIQKDILDNLKFDIDISPSIDINQNIESIKNLFNLITFKNIMPFKSNKIQKLTAIQDYYIENKIKIMHKYIWSKNNTSIENAKKYFSIYKNCLLGINKKETLNLIENNYDSIKYINISGFALEEYDYKGGINLKKIKFDYPTEEFNNILLNKINFENLEQISGLIVSQQNINLFIKKINSMKNLKKIKRIKFGLTEEEDEDDNIKEKLFKDFFNGIQKKHGDNLIEITTWWKKFKKGKDYDFILNNFPNIRKIQEDYDASGLYDQRIELDKIFSCNAEDEFQENDLIAITKMVKNYIKQKKEGENSIKFELYNNYSRFEQLINFWKNNNNNEILNKINYINFVISDCNDHDKPLPLNKINIFDFKNDNISLLNAFKETKIINQVIINNTDSLSKQINLLANDKNIISIVINKDNLTKEELNFLKQIKGLKYLILNNKIINDNKMNEGEFPFRIIPKIYFANTTEMP